MPLPPSAYLPKVRTTFNELILGTGATASLAEAACRRPSYAWTEARGVGIVPVAAPVAAPVAVVAVVEERVEARTEVAAAFVMGRFASISPAGDAPGDKAPAALGY